MSAASNLRQRLDRWIFESHPASAESLSLYRILFAGYMLVFGMPHSTWMRSMPVEMWDPPGGPLRLLSDFPPAPLLLGATFLLSLSLVALLVGYCTRLASFASGVLLFVLVGFEFCFGKIDHTRHLMMIVPLALASSGWGARYSLDAVRGTAPTVLQAWPLAWLALCLGLFFYSGGVAKLGGGWLDLDSHAVQYYAVRAGTASPDLLSGAAWEVLDYLIVLFETGFVLAVLRLRMTRIACATAVLFHFSNLFVMHIDFTEQLVIYGAFVAWDRVPVISRLGKVAPSAAAWLDRAPWLVILGGALYFVFHEVLGSPISATLPWPPAARIAYWSLPAAFAALHLIREAHAVLAASRD